jgi:aminocarboxymuconate-semialdehyde decarboxylase
MGGIVMTTRRNFLKGGVAAAAGVVFCSCGMLHGASAQATRQKLPVMVGGKRVKTIDVHAHCVIPEASKLLGPAPVNT